MEHEEARESTRPKSRKRLFAFLLLFVLACASLALYTALNRQGRYPFLAGHKPIHQMVVGDVQMSQYTIPAKDGIFERAVRDLEADGWVRDKAFSGLGSAMVPGSVAVFSRGKGLMPTVSTKRIPGGGAAMTFSMPEMASVSMIDLPIVGEAVGGALGQQPTCMVSITRKLSPIEQGYRRLKGLFIKEEQDTFTQTVITSGP